MAFEPLDLLTTSHPTHPLLPFGPIQPRLARLKHSLDPRNVLAFACPLPKAPTQPKLIILVTGGSCSGKDYCADVWVSVFIRCTQKSLAARAVSISDATKREYAEATGADLNRLLWDRVYKEQHRPTLTAFFQEQVRQRPRLPEEHFFECGVRHRRCGRAANVWDERRGARRSLLASGARQKAIRGSRPS